MIRSPSRTSPGWRGWALSRTRPTPCRNRSIFAGPTRGRRRALGADEAAGLAVPPPGGGPDRAAVEPPCGAARRDPFRGLHEALGRARVRAFARREERLRRGALSRPPL